MSVKTVIEVRPKSITDLKALRSLELLITENRPDSAVVVLAISPSV